MKSKITLWLVILISLISINILVLYFLSGFFIILHTEKGMTEILDKYMKADLISAIAALASFGATYMAYRATERAAISSEKANINASRPERVKTTIALLEIWNFLNSKSCVLCLNEQNPEIFLISKNEISNLNKYHEAMLYDSLAYGNKFNKKVTEFYISIKSELIGQCTLHEWDNGK